MFDLKASPVSTFVFCLCLTLCTLPALAAPAIRLQPFVSGVSAPVDLQTARDGSGRLFVVEQSGRVRIIQNGALLPDAFLDVSSIIEWGDEKGLLGLAFHPQYSQNGRFFVNYTRRVSGQLQSVIAEYHVSSSNPNKADPNGSEVLVVDQPFDNHNGGQIAFGPKQMLYIGFGDGGSGGDPFGNGQNLDTLLGKMLRIDINSGAPYKIPPDNPFVGNPNAKGEIWAYGFRNPWRFSFDRTSGQLMAGDVGQDNWEEVDIVRKGGNYGWNILEGFHCYPPGTTSCDRQGKTPPIFDYSHAEGSAVIGGYVYHGAAVASLRGTYVFGDLSGGKIWGLRKISGTWRRTTLLTPGLLLSGFGQDEKGELYVLDYGNGVVNKIVPQ